MSNFILDCINGDTLLSDVNDYIDNWHNDDQDIPIFKYLGMTKKEYALFVTDEAYLAFIVTAHKDKVDIENIIKNQLAMAARSDNHAKSERLERWLKDEDLWD